MNYTQRRMTIGWKAINLEHSCRCYKGTDDRANPSLARIGLVGWNWVYHSAQACLGLLTHQRGLKYFCTKALIDFQNSLEHRPIGQSNFFLFSFFLIFYLCNSKRGWVTNNHLHTQKRKQSTCIEKQNHREGAFQGFKTLERRIRADTQQLDYSYVLLILQLFNYS